MRERERRGQIAPFIVDQVYLAVARQLWEGHTIPRHKYLLPGICGVEFRQNTNMDSS